MKLGSFKGLNGLQGSDQKDEEAAQLQTSPWTVAAWLKAETQGRGERDPYTALSLLLSN